MTTRITLDGYALDSSAYKVTTRNGWDSVAAKVGENVRVGGRDGQVWQAKDYDSARMVLDIVVMDAAPEGGAASAAQFQTNLDRLAAILGKRHGLITVDKLMEDGTTRRNYGEVTAYIEPTMDTAANLALVKAELTFPNPFWSATSTSTFEPAGSATSPRTIEITALEGSTAPINDAVVLFVGPATNPRITDDVSGAWIQYTGTLTASQTMRINAGTWDVQVGNGLDYESGMGTNVVAAITFNNPRLLPLTPDAEGVISVTLTGTGFASGTTIKVKAKRRFLT